MKKPGLIAGLVSVLAAASFAPRVFGEAPKPAQHRVVFELTSDDAQAWDGLLNNVENVQKALGPTSIEVVAHGKGLAMLTSAKSSPPVQARLKKHADSGVLFAACENTMRKQSLAKDDLVPFAKTVDSGVAEVVRKQESGWSYLRTAP